MFEGLLTYLAYGKTYCGVEYCSVGSTETIHATLLKKNRSILDVSDSFKFHGIENLSAKLPKNQHVHLTVNGQQVLTKIIDGKHPDVIKAVHKAFPNLNLDDFYCEILPQKESSIISICRKEYINGLLDSYKKQKIRVIGFSLGVMPLSSLVDYLPDGELVLSNNQRVTLFNGTITNILANSSTSEFSRKLNINGIQTPEGELLSLASALKGVLGSKTHSNFEGVNGSLDTVYREHRFSSQFLKFGLGFVLLTLLVNFGFFNYYFEKTSQLTQLSQINQESKASLLQLNGTVNKKETMVEDLIKNGRSKSSFFVNDIVSLMPESVLLASIEYQPLLKRLKENEDVQVDKNRILVSGNSNDSNEFSKFIRSLEALDWIDKVDIVDYGTESGTIPTFAIKISMKDEGQ